MRTRTGIFFRRLALMQALALSLPAAIYAQGIEAESQDDFNAEILRLHNEERAQLGIPPVRWDPLLAASAAAYGPELAAQGRLVHSPRSARPGQRENLARIQTSLSSPQALVGSWIHERSNFQPGIFPAVSRTGSWHHVAHYSQMIWKSTTHIGCALHRTIGWHYLICRYSPPGNIDGRAVP